MIKGICLVLVLLMICLISLPAMAAPEAPEISMQPQSPDYPEYFTATYTVKATGTNLTAIWYMEWQGKTYTISDVGGSIQDWEPYAGETYGPMKLDSNTFSFVFEGISSELSGANIWCVIEDGHYDVVSQKAKILVHSQYSRGYPRTPPEILSIPTQMTVEQGDEAEIRCVARSVDESQLSFRWYETDTGRMEDMRAVDRGTEEADYLICDTSSIGTRNYLCLVESGRLGIVYSSVVPVTVIEKKVESQVPEETLTETTPAAELETTQTQFETSSVAETETMQTEETIPQEDVPDTTVPSETDNLPTSTNEQSVSSTTESPSQPQIDTSEKNESAEVPWWVLLLIGVVAAGIGIITAVALIKK